MAILAYKGMKEGYGIYRKIGNTLVEIHPDGEKLKSCVDNIKQLWIADKMEKYGIDEIQMQNHIK